MNSIIAWVGVNKRLREQIIDEFPKEKLGLYVVVLVVLDGYFLQEINTQNLKFIMI